MVSLNTYTNRKILSGAYATPTRASLNVTNVIPYVPSYSTKFSLMQGQTYNTNPALSDDEAKAISSGWYCITAIRT
jgi:hypothetical protein